MPALLRLVVPKRSIRQPVVVAWVVQKCQAQAVGWKLEPGPAPCSKALDLSRLRSEPPQQPAAERPPRWDRLV